MPISETDVRWIETPKTGAVRAALFAGHLAGSADDGQAHVSAQGHAAVPGGAAEAAAQLSRRASAQPRRGGPRQVRRLLHVLDGVPGPLHRHRGRPVALAGSREVSRDLRHRRAALHLLRHVRAGVSRATRSS